MIGALLQQCTRWPAASCHLSSTSGPASYFCVVGWAVEAAVLLLGPAGEELEGTEVHCRVMRVEGGLLLWVALGPGTTVAETQPGRLALRGLPAVLALEAGPEGTQGTVLH
jgi:hypothetical protein